MVPSVTYGNIFSHPITEALGGAGGPGLGKRKQRPGPERYGKESLHCLLRLLARRFSPGVIMKLVLTEHQFLNFIIIIAAVAIVLIAGHSSRRCG